ncbi:hypothetical protein [Paraburkholderia acidisoli]|uniref:Transmembrane protein n=1 Tax=Paraburkholderia acidisoli TaxID=2571748 RepID=A0A7Z2JDM8_9BURK|nr:hypothetical protein [Paraburkholderia acidisoli]QGZ61372.1 hypothetical protein FAZ98_06300 [Paraburkholderia acidisoli]
MKPLLRVLLIVDALTLLGFGVLFVLTPWTLLYNALQLVQAQPALVGQAFGVVLLGLAWVALRAAFDGAMTVPVARAIGHVNWIAGVLMLVWLIGLHTPQLTTLGQLAAGAVGIWLIVLGFGGARLGGAVRKRDRVLAAEAAMQAREAREAAKARRDEPVLYAKPGFLRSMPWGKARDTATVVEPVEPAVAPAVSPAVKPVMPEAPASSIAPESGATHGTTYSATHDTARSAAREEAADAPRPPLRG